MEVSVLLLNMTLLLLVSAICTVVFKKLKMPTIVGYLVAGIILANYWVGENSDTELIVKILADLGLVMLMFCIGMELNLKKIRKTGMFALMVMMIQVPLIMAGGYVFGMFMGWNAIQCLLFGAIISGSSTAVVTAVLHDQQVLTREEADTVILITVIEDVAQVMILSMLSPMLVGSSMSIGSVVLMFITIIIFMVSIVGLGLLVVPRLLEWIGDKMQGEILLVSALGICFAVSLLSVYIGMSMAIGAFLIGVVVSQSKYYKQIEKDITPMKDIFMAMFFISIGLAITPSELIAQAGMIALFYAVYFVLKASTVFLAYYIGNKPMRHSFLSSISLVAMGEFAFIIAKAGLDANVISNDFYTAVIGAALASMIILPIISKYTDNIIETAAKRGPRSVKKVFANAEKFQHDMYAKMSLSSRTTTSKFKRKLTVTYVEAMLLVALIAVIYFGGPFMANALSLALPKLGFATCHLIVLLLAFLLLMVPLYHIVSNLKFVEKYFLDIERRAEEKGTGSLDSRWARFHKSVLKVNIWIMVFFLDFLILLFMPSPLGLWEHVTVMVSGMAVTLLVYYLKYCHKS